MTPLTSSNPAWRLLMGGMNDAYLNMAVDEAIMRLHKQIGIPTIRLYGWEPAAVSIGCFQSIEDEIYVDRCERMGIEYVRRITGGGAVFHDKEVTYSLVMSEDDIDKSIPRSYEKICAGVILGLRMLDIAAEFSSINDIMVKGRKISGNAQTRRDGVLLQHGTVLLDIDEEKLSAVLRISSEKIKGKGVSSVVKHLTSVMYETGHADFDQVADCLARGFERAFGIRLVQGYLKKEEIDLAKELLWDRYLNQDWIFKRKFSYSLIIVRR